MEVPRITMRNGVRVLVAGLALGTVCAVFPGTAMSQSDLLTREEALAAVFPGARFEAERVFLTDDQITRAQELAGGDPSRALVARYIARRDGEIVGRAYVDTHVVRTKRESLLISLDVNREVRRVDVTAFLEPPEYVASERWLQQYQERALDGDLAVGRAIRPIAGGTLTGAAANAAVRRVLAIDQVLESAAE
jgi:electron transport complex protein RnfG